MSETKQMTLKAFACYKRQDVAGIRTQTPQSWAVNKEGYVTCFFNFIPNGIKFHLSIKSLN